MNHYHCTLCRSSDFTCAHYYQTADVVRKYLERFKLDVSGYFGDAEFDLRQCCHCDLQSYYPAQFGDEALYRQLQLSPMYYEEDKPEFSFAREVLQQVRPERVLEVGCGVGHFLRKIKSAYRVAGSETNDAAVVSLKKKGIALDGEGHKYDFVVAFQVLEHVADVRQFLTEIVDKLESGGHLLLTVPNPKSLYLQEVDDALDYPPHHMTRWSMQALENIAQYFPLTKVSGYCEPLRIEHYRSIIVARRRKISGRGLYGRVMGRLGDCFDALYAPFSYGHCGGPGHTHAIVFIKD